jgi:hypothetical protein
VKEEELAMKMSNPPVDAIVKIVEYMEHDERKHFRSMEEDGEDTSGHIFYSVQAVADWLAANGVAWRDPHEELVKEIEEAFAAAGVPTVDAQSADAGKNWAEKLAETLPDTRYVGASYTCELPDERDEVAEDIFNAHGYGIGGIDSGYHFESRQRDLGAYVPAARAEACVAALTAAGFRAGVLRPEAVTRRATT